MVVSFARSSNDSVRRVIASRRREDMRGVRAASWGRTSCSSPGTCPAIGACAGSRAMRNWPARRAFPRFTHERLRQDTDGLIALSGCRHGEIARRLLAGDRARCEGRRAPADRRVSDGHFYLELQHHLLADDDWLVAETVGLADELGPAARRDQRRALRAARRPRAAGRARLHPPRQDARGERPPAPAERRVLPRRVRPSLARCRRRRARWVRRRGSAWADGACDGGGDRRRAARSTSTSSNTDFRALRCRRARRRSRTSRRCATRACAPDTTRSSPRW